MFHVYLLLLISGYGPTCGYSKIRCYIEYVCCVLVVGCLLNVQEVKYDFGIQNVVCLLATCYKHACLLVVS